MNSEEIWQEEIQILQSIIEKTELEAAIKWGIKIYTYRGKNVVGAVGFKNHFCLWFYNGVFLSDPYQKLINAQEGKTKALRQWRFHSADEIEENKIMEYIREAIGNEEMGKVWKPEKTGELAVPDFFQKKLEEVSELNEAFEALSPFRKKEYLEYLDTAKREATQISRMEKIIPMIIKGIGLNDKYR